MPPKTAEIGNAPGTDVAESYSVLAWRHQVSIYKHTLPKSDKVTYVIERVELPTMGHHAIECYVYEPKDSEGRSLNTLFEIPGTASQAYSLSAIQVISTYLCEILDCRVITIFHRLPPEDKYPDPYNDICHVINYYLHRSSYQLNRIALGGYSSGGYLSLLIAFNAVKAKVPICQLLLIAPVVDMQITSMLKDAEKEKVPSVLFRHFVSIFLPREQARTDPSISPAHCSDEVLSQLPPMIIVLGENDILYPSVKSFQEQLSGKRCHFHVVPDSDHTLAWQTVDYLYAVKPMFSDNFSHSVVPTELHARLEPIPLGNRITFGQHPSFQPSFYVNRKQCEEYLCTAFESSPAEHSDLVTCYGSSGVGKTQLALYYYLYSRREYAQRFWFDMNTARLTYLELGDEIQRSTGQVLFKEDMTSEEKIERVRLWLETQESALIVFDNVESLEKLMLFLPRRRGHVLITGHFPVEDKNIEVKELDQAEGQKFILNFFAHRSIDKEIALSSTECESLSALLNGSIIAIQLACLYMMNFELTISDFEASFRGYQKEHVEITNPETICLALVVQGLSKREHRYLQYLALCATFGIPRVFFQSESMDKAGELLLRKWHLIQSDTDLDTVSTHQCYQRGYQNTFA